MKPDDAKAARDKADDTPTALRVDLDGIARRVAAFPVPEGRFDQIAGVAGDKVVWTLMPVAGAHGRGGHKDLPGRLEVFDFSTKKDRHAGRQGRPLRDRRTITSTLVLRHGKRVRAIRADRMPDPRERAHAVGRRAVAQERLDRSSARARFRRSARANGGRCCTKCGGCSATSSGCPTCRASTGRRCTRATSRCSTASRRAASCPT